MTDKEIIKITEICSKAKTAEDCEMLGCPCFAQSTCIFCDDSVVFEKILDLINRQKTENEKLQDLIVKINAETAKQEAEIERLNYENLQMIASIKNLNANNRRY